MSFSTVMLREVVEVKTGSKNPKATSDEMFTYVDVAAVDNEAKAINWQRSLLGSEAPSRARKSIRQGDVLVSTVRPNLNAVALVPASLDGAVASTGFCVLRANSRVLPEYLLYFVRSRDFVENLCTLVAGAMYPAVSDSQVLDQQLLLPPLPEQRRIVDLLSRAEGIVRLRRESEKKAAELIPALFIDMFGDPATNPKGWLDEPLGNHVMIPTSVRTPDLFSDADMPCMGADSIESMSGKLISMPLVRDVLPKSGKYSFDIGDVLYSKIRPYLAKVTLARCKGYCSADMYPLRCSSTLRPLYLTTLLLGRAFTEYATAESVRASMPKLNRESLFKYQLPVPPVKLQDMFAVNADAVQSIQSQQSAATAKAQATFDALLARCFAQDVAAEAGNSH